MAPKKSYRLVRFTADGFKRLSAVEITPDGSPLVHITGNNAQGKSSVLDGIEALLRGKKAMPPRPVRAGGKVAHLTGDFTHEGEAAFTISRTISADGSDKLKIVSKDPTVTSKQGFLDGLLGPLSFDPHAFLSLRPKEQADALRAAIGIDTRNLDARRVQFYDARTEAGRDIKRLEGAIAETPFPIGPDEPVDVGALLQRMTEAGAEKESARTLERDLFNARSALSVAQLSVIAAEAAFKAAVDERHLAAVAVEQFEQQLEVVDVPDTTALEAEIATANNRNAIAAQRLKGRGLRIELEKAQAMQSDLTDKIEAVDVEKATMLEAAHFPLEGVGIEGDQVMVGGQPVEQASASERLRFAVALGLATSGAIRVVLIRDGSLLDSEAVADVVRMAGEAGAQVWLESVGTGIDQSWEIVDGAVAAVPA